MGIKINPDKDEVYYENKKIENKIKKYVYILLNKPIGYVTTVADQFGRKTVLDLIESIEERVLPVGRLDMYTSGALILTNDGDFIYKVTHPKHEIEKTYIVTVRGVITDKEIEELKSGMYIDGYKTKPAKVRIMKINLEKNISRVQITIHEGKNRQIRKMCESIGKKVIALHRNKIGGIEVKDLKIGQWRYLKKDEINSLVK